MKYTHQSLRAACAKILSQTPELLANGTFMPTILNNCVLEIFLDEAQFDEEAVAIIRTAMRDLKYDGCLKCG